MSHSAPLVFKFCVLILIYFRVTIMEIFLNVFIWVWFLWLFNFSVILLNLHVVKCLHHAIFNSHYLLVIFMSVLHVFCRHSNINLIHFYWLLLLLPVLKFSAPALLCYVIWNQLFEFYRSSTDWLPHDARSGCGESQNRLLTVLCPYFFCLLVFYFYIAPLWGCVCVLQIF